MPDPADPEPRREETVPRDRFDKLNEKHRALTTQLSELTDALEEAKKLAGRVPELENQIESHAVAAAQWADERGIISLGITDPDEIDLTRLAWSRVEESKRPKGGLGEWLGAEGAAPKALKSLIPDRAAAGAGEEPTPVQPKGLPAPNRNARAEPAKHGAVVWTADKVESLSPAEYAKHRDAIMAETTALRPPR